MDRIDYLLACLGEECGEVQQDVGKALRFGVFDKDPITGEENFNKITKEVHDILAVYEMLCDEIGTRSTINNNTLKLKKARVEYYMKYSIEVGRLSGD